MSEQTTTLDQMKARVRAEYPDVRTLGWFWWFKAWGAPAVENTDTQECESGEIFRMFYVTVIVSGKEYLLRFGKVSP